MRSLAGLRKRAIRWNSTSTTATTTTSSPTSNPPHATTPLRSVLIANRGEIALRVSRTASQYGILTTTLYTEPDRTSQHALSSPHNLNLGSTDQYLNGTRIIELAKQHAIQAIHPGYGFLSENAAFAKACTDAGINFIGPPWKAIEAMGDKARSKEIMLKAGVPCIPGYHGSEQDPGVLEREAEKIGYPVLLKAVKGGGGKGMRIVQSPDDFASQLESAKSEARSSFGDDVMLVEKYITTPRHIEVQVFADKHGNCVALGERDCSIQRRHQKILEESPAPNLREEVRQDLWEKARQAALAVGYEGAGTVEFIFDNDSKQFFFMEMNTRLQVEHPVTEMVTGLDLVHWQILVAEGHPLPLSQDEIIERIKQRGHAIEARIYAEDPSLNFTPSTGTLLHLRTPSSSDNVRIDSGFVEGDEVSSHYDPMISKLIVSGPNRTSALRKLERALEEYEVGGVVTNIEFLKRVARSPNFVEGEVETGYIPKHYDELFAKEVVDHEVWMQAALGLYENQRQLQQGNRLGQAMAGQTIGFASTPQPREFRLAKLSSDPRLNANPEPVNVKVFKTAPNTFTVSLGETTYSNVTATYVLRRTGTGKGELTTFYPHTRLTTTLLHEPPTAPTQGTSITVFHLGRLYRLSLLPPPFLAKALGATAANATNSVLAPMPCKVIRVSVKAGDRAKAGQELLVIESMKMETVIRAPSLGTDEELVVKRVVKGVGEMCKVGVALVEFEEKENEDGGGKT
ncbi:hypothetical protein BAUCODRAFT_36779 [Baudoinia panamericana UAMH 10762]|uniref:Uncharacterized protein n=1 Tax=Baudoinia panamericana (strain UAMH 10762) TaxID=717646 RepID=M2MS24_BAUPA|nr:uncharacterized protein BAUCODRAFT_36779 [Baudoinia panamericana UAMH 10762]EMC94303.1 hypothetical protein BAUCODRAFT_36779 [Baudoinia panamericana UAMH 10762]